MSREEDEDRQGPGRILGCDLAGESLVKQKGVRVCVSLGGRWDGKRGFVVVCVLNFGSCRVKRWLLWEG